MPKKLLFCVALLFCLTSLGQKDSLAVKYDDSPLEKVDIEKEDIQAFLDDERFDYKIEKVDNSWWEDIKNWFYNLVRRFFEWIFGVDRAPSYLAVFLKLLPYLLLGLLLYLIIRFFINVNSRALLDAKKNENLVSLSEEERIIKTEDIHGLIQQAVADKNYRLAIRYYYLLILRQLSEGEHIDWKPQKTNDDYLNELANEQLKTGFSKVTLLYDYIWYGEFTIENIAYEKAVNVFTTLQNQIGHG